MKNRKRRNSSPGMFTVEMTLVFPVVFFTILGLMYIGMVQHQTVVTRTAAMRTASRAAYCWNALGSAESAWNADGSLKSFDYTNHDPYAGIVGAIAPGNQEKNAERYFQWLQGENPELLAEESYEGLEVNYHMGLLAPKVEAKITGHYKNPMGHLLESIGIGTEQTYEISASASATDPTEFIRTVGLVYDIFKS